MKPFAGSHPVCGLPLLLLHPTPTPPPICKEHCSDHESHLLPSRIEMHLHLHGPPCEHRTEGPRASSTGLQKPCPVSLVHWGLSDRMHADGMQDWELLQEYVQHQSESAFRALVARHLGLVHSAALRQVNSGRSPRKSPRPFSCCWHARHQAFRAAHPWPDGCLRRPASTTTTLSLMGSDGQRIDNVR
jgi:hypothetical protein